MRGTTRCPGSRWSGSPSPIADPALPSFDAETKRSDSRWEWFVDEYGERCWELDALNPNVLRDRARGAIESQLNRTAWDRSMAAEAAEAESLRSVLDGWNGRDGERR